MTNISYTEGYADKSVLKEIYDLKRNKQDELTAGENIIISGNVISAVGGGIGYIAGNGIDISNGVISTPIASTNVEITEQ